MENAFLGWMKKYLAEPLLLAMFPDCCTFCNKIIRVNTFICEECANAVKRQAEPICHKCGRSKEYCSCKQDGRRVWDGATAPFIYDDGITGSCIRRLKESGYERNATYLGTEIAKQVRKTFPLTVFDCVMPVPMHPQDEFERGYAQCVWLAKSVAKELGIPYENRLRKIRRTTPQKKLSGEERRVNLRGAFDVDEMFDTPGKTILLVDDLLTTGSTLEECATMLKIYGAEAVYVATVCITRKEGKKDGRSKTRN